MDNTPVNRQQRLYFSWVILLGGVGILLLSSVFLLPLGTNNHANASASASGTAMSTVVAKSPTPTTTPTPTPEPVTFDGSFEHGTLQGWSRVGNVLNMRVNNNKKFAHSGSHSLQLTFQSKDAHKDFPYIDNQSPDLSSLINIHGATLTTYIYVPTQTKHLSAELFVSNDQHKQFVSGELHTLAAQRWNKLNLVIPSTAGKSFHWESIGIQVHSNQANVKNTIYIDDIQLH